VREELAKAVGYRTVFFGTVSRFGSKKGFKGRPAIETLCLVDVRDRSGRISCDHLWFVFTAGFKRAAPELGDRVQFDARVRPYLKGYRGGRNDPECGGVTTDYKLSNPTGIRVIARRGSRPDRAANSFQAATLFD
jgi:hypothetical protein